MVRLFTRWCVLAVACCVAGAASAAGQDTLRVATFPVSVTPLVPTGELHGTVQDTAGQPIAGAMVSASAAGVATVTVKSDRRGQYTFPHLTAGAYLIRVHADGFVPPTGRYVQVNAGRRQAWTASMERMPAAAPSVLLTAGFGGPDGETGEAGAPKASPDPVESEVLWRLRHLKRGVLKDARLVPDGGVDGESAFGGLARASESPGSSAPAFLADLVLNGQVNFISTTSYDRTLDLFSVDPGMPQPIAYVALVAPGGNGDWKVRGSMTQGDVSSWVLAASYARHDTGRHQYEAGVSYATQRYDGANVDALAAMRDESRTAGEFFVSDTWTITPQIMVGAGGRYASYAYLEDRSLISGHTGLIVRPLAHDPLRLSLTAVYRETAPGAEEFVAPAVGLWLPPERTFAALSHNGLRPERLSHVEVGGERDIRGGLIVGLRAFHQQVDDQFVTLFGVALPESVATPAHYQVGTAGDFEAYGWGVSVTRAAGNGTEASVVYTQVGSRGMQHLVDADPLMQISTSLLRRPERFHDLTASLNSRVDATATRIFLVYKLSTAYADAESAMPVTGARFEVQVSQELPFLDFTGASWEMLAGVRNLFRSDVFGGSVYDELLVVRPPTRVMAGVTVRF